MGRKFLGTRATASNELITKSFIDDALVNKVGVTVITSAISSFNNNAHTLGLFWEPVSVVHTTANSTVFSRQYPYNPLASSEAFKTVGGKPVATGIAGRWDIVSSTPNGTTQKAGVWRVSFMADADVLEIGLAGGSDRKYRIMVEGRYISYDALDMTGADNTVAVFNMSLLTRTTREITIEGQQGDYLLYVSTKSDQTIYSATNSPIKMAIVGDQNIDGMSQDIKANAVARIIGDHLGIQDTRICGSAGTGFLANAGGTANPYSSRRSDWIGAAPDIVVMQGSINDIAANFTPQQVAAAAQIELQAIRTALPNALIILFGIATSLEYVISNNQQDLYRTHEAALMGVVTVLNDPLITFVPLLHDLEAGNPLPSTPLTGAGPGMGNWSEYINTDKTLTTRGHRYYGKFLAGRIAWAISKITKIAIAAYAPLSHTSPSATPRVVTKTVSTTLDNVDVYSKALYVNAATSTTLTIPADSAFAYGYRVPVGTQIGVLQTGDGSVSIAAGTGVTLRLQPGYGYQSQGPYLPMAILKVAANDWLLIGTGLITDTVGFTDEAGSILTDEAAKYLTDSTS